jgi:hypothetical protein
VAIFVAMLAVFAQVASKKPNHGEARSPTVTGRLQKSPASWHKVAQICARDCLPCNLGMSAYINGCVPAYNGLLISSTAGCFFLSLARNKCVACLLLYHRHIFNARSQRLTVGAL